jgi:ZIP family zinc transporter
MLPLSVQAGLWGALSGSALVLGAALAWFATVPQRVVAGVMAFGSGVLISALSFELMNEAFEAGGFDSTSIGFLAGAAIYTGANIYISKRGAKHRKRSGHNKDAQPQGQDAGLAIAAGALIDGIPESIVIGVSMIGGGTVGWVAVVAIFLSNVPEGLSSTAGMKKAGHSAAYVFSLWLGIAVISGISSLVGYTLFAGLSQEVIAATQAVAAGAILAMIVDTMIPEAFEVAHDYAGLITVTGFLAAFILSKFAAS